MIQAENNGVNEGTSNISHFAMILYPGLVSVCSPFEWKRYISVNEAVWLRMDQVAWLFVIRFYLEGFFFIKTY